jgi:hypothetical protein
VIRKISTVLASMFLLSIILQFSLPLSYAETSIPEKYKRISTENALEELSSKKNMQVYSTLPLELNNNLNELISKKEVNLKELKDKKIRKQKDINVIVVDEISTSDLIKSQNARKIIDDYLNDGFILYLQGNVDKPKLMETIGNGGPSATVSGQVDDLNSYRLPNGKLHEPMKYKQQFMWITKTSGNEYVTGAGYFPEQFNDQREINRQLIINAWHRQNDKKVKTAVAPATTQKLINEKLVNTVLASNSEDFSIGNAWEVWGWNQNVFYNSDSSTNPITFGYTTVWNTWADLVSAGDRYIAYIGQMYLEPTSTSTYGVGHTWGAFVGGDVNYSVPGNQLYQYQPLTSPNNYQMSWQLGGGLSAGYQGGSGYNASISANYQVGMTSNESDIYITDSSRISEQYSDVWIGYRHYDICGANIFCTTPDRTYPLGQSRQDFSVITKAVVTGGSTKIAIKNIGYYYDKRDTQSDANSDPKKWNSSGAYWIWTLNGIY